MKYTTTAGPFRFMRNSPEYIFLTDRGHAEIAHEGWQG
jgi:hypothetical protein